MDKETAISSPVPRNLVRLIYNFVIKLGRSKLQYRQPDSLRLPSYRRQLPRQSLELPDRHPQHH